MSLEKQYDELNGEIDGLFPSKGGVQKSNVECNGNKEDELAQSTSSKFEEVPCGPPGGYVISPEND